MWVTSKTGKALLQILVSSHVEGADLSREPIAFALLHLSQSNGERKSPLEGLGVRLTTLIYLPQRLAI